MFQTERTIFRSPEAAGSLEEIPFAELMGAIVRRGASGTLTVEKRDEIRTFFFRRGELQLAISSRPEQRLGAFLRNRGQLTEAQLNEALSEANRRENVYFGEILLEKGWISGETLASEVRRLSERIVVLTFPWSRGRYRFVPREKAIDPRLALTFDTSALVFEGVVRLPETERFAERLGSPGSVPYRGKPPAALRASSPAGLFLTRVDGKTTCAELLRAGPGNPGNAAKLLYGFRCAGWVRWPEDRPGAPFDREKFEETWRRIDWIPHYDLLGVPASASDEEIRNAIDRTRAGLDASELGDPALARKAEAILARLAEAERALTEPGRRLAYDRELSGAVAIPAGPEGGDADLRRETAISSYRRAQELIRLRDYYPAVKMLEQAARWDPEIAEYRYLLGLTQRRNPMWKERALENLREAARLDPSRADISAALADALLDRKAVDEAEPYVERARAVPGHGEVSAPLQNRFDEARAAEVEDEPEPKPRFWERFRRRSDALQDLEERARELEQHSRELAAANESLKQLSLIDGLTGVGNRRRFDAALAQEWARALKEHSHLTIVMIDVDHFKAFNDALGHQSGDEFLQIVARSLASVVQREQDVLARYGGEEFAVVLRPSGPAEAASLAEAFRAKIERMRLRHPASPGGPFLTVSVGVATGKPRKGFSPSTLVAAADQALYKSKREGRNRVTAVDSAF